MFFHGFLVEFIRFALNNAESALRAFAQARSQAVAIKIGDHPGLAVNYFQGTFGAGWNTIAATVT
jgi:hypothetical protein